MPFKSRAQAAYFNIHRKELEAQGVDVGEWNRASKGMKLPKHAAIGGNIPRPESDDEGFTDEAMERKERREIHPKEFLSSRGYWPLSDAGLEENEEGITHEENLGYKDPQYLADGGMKLQRTAPYPEAPEGYEFYGPAEGEAPSGEEKPPAPPPAANEYELQRQQAEALPQRRPVAMEPDLSAFQTREQEIPEGYAVNDAGIIFNKETGEELPQTRRSNVLPFTKTPEGQYVWNFPKVMDILGNMGGGWSAPVGGTAIGVGARLSRRPRTGPLNVDTFFEHASPSEVEHMTNNDLFALRDQLAEHPEPKQYWEKNPELWDALHERIDNIEKQEYREDTQHNYGSLNELEQAVQRRFEQVHYEPPKPGVSEERSNYVRQRRAIEPDTWNNFINGRTVDLDEFMAQATPHDIMRLNPEQLRNLRSQVRKEGDDWDIFRKEYPQEAATLESRLKDELGFTPHTKPKESDPLRSLADALLRKNAARLQEAELADSEAHVRGIPSIQTLEEEMASLLGRPPRQQAMTPAQAKEWIRQNTRVDNPEQTFGYSDPQDYVHLQRQLAEMRAEAERDARAGGQPLDQRIVAVPAGSTHPQEVHPNAPINNGKPMDLPTFAAKAPYHPETMIGRLTDDQLFRLGDELNEHQNMGSGLYSNLENYQPKVITGLRNEIRARETASYTNRPAEIDPRELAEALNDVATRGRQSLLTRRPRVPTQPVSPSDYTGNLGRPPRDISGHGPDYAQNVYRDVRQQARSGWENGFRQYLAPHYSDSNEFLNNYFGGYKFVSEDEPHWNLTGGFYLSGRILNEAGRPIANISRDFNPATKTAHHGYWQVNRDARGTGVTPKVLKNQIENYKKLGIEKVNLNANIDVGSYAWAKYGWLPSRDGWRALANRIKGQVESNQWQMSPIAKRHVLMILSEPDPKAMWVLSDLTDAVPGSNSKRREIGKMILKDRSWLGTLDMKDPETMARFDEYVSRKIKEAEQKKESK